MSSRLERLRERFRADPAAKQVFETLEEHHFLAGEWDELVGIYDERLAALPLGEDNKTRAAVLMRKAQILDDRRGDVDAAVACYGEAIRADSEQHSALRRLREIHTSREQWDLALQIAEMESGLTMPVVERAALLAGIGSIWLDHLDDPAAACAEFERALALNPEDTKALAGAARALEACDRNPEAASAWERLIPGLEGAERARALVSQARLVEATDANRAGDLYRRALTDDPRNLAASEALSGHAAAAGNWNLLSDLLERRYELVRDPSARAEIALEAGRVHHENLRDLNMAQTWVERAVNLVPEYPPAYHALADLARERGDESQLLQCVERVLELSAGSPPIWALLEVASLHADRGDELRALEFLQQALEVAPTDTLVNAELSDALLQLGRYEELVDVLEQRAELATNDPDGRAQILVELAEVQADQLDDPGAQQQALERAFEARPAAPGVANALDRIYRKSESWDELRELLEAAGRDGPTEQRAAFLCSLGELLEKQFENPAAATLAFQDALDVDPQAADAHRGLHQLAETGNDPAAVLAAYEREVEFTTDPVRLSELMRELMRMAESQGDLEVAREWAHRWSDVTPDASEPLSEWARLLDNAVDEAELSRVLTRLEALLEGSEAAAVRRRLGALHQAAGRREEAIRCYEAALEASPDDVEALEALSVQYDVANRVHDLVRIRERLADLLPPPRNAFFLDALASVLAERLGDLHGAIDVLMRLSATEGAPDDVDERLDGLLDAAGRHEALADRLRARKDKLRPGSPEFGAIALALGRRLLLLHHFEEAATAFREAHAATGEPEAQEGIERACRAAGDAKALAGFLADQAQTSDDPETRDQRALESAVLLQDSEDQVDEAVDAFRRLAGTSSDAAIRREASERLELLLERQGAWSQLREHLYATLSSGSAEEDAERHERMGRLCRDRLGDPEGAADHFEEAARLAPQRPHPWRDLAQIYEADERHQDLARALEGELAANPDAERELTLRTQAADLYTRTLRDERRARAHYQRVFELDSSHSAAAEYLIAPFEREGQYTQVVRILEARLDAVGGATGDGVVGDDAAARRASLRIRIAGLRANHLDDLDGAISALESAVGDIGPEAVVAEPLADLYEKAGYHQELVDLCKRTSAATDDSAERANWLLRLGSGLQHCGEKRDSVAAYQRVLHERPDDRDARAALRELYRELDQAEDLAQLIESSIPQLAGREEVEARVELAAIQASQLGCPAEALTHLRRVLQLDPTHSDALDRALAMAEVLGDDQATLEILDGALDRWQPPAARAGLLARRGSTLAHVMNRPDEAVACLREALALDSRSPVLRAELRAVLESQGRWAEALDLLYAESDGRDDETRAAVLEQAVATATEKLSPDAALPWLERLRALRPDDSDVLQRIAKIHKAAGRPGAQLLALDYELRLVQDEARKLEILVERASALESQLESPALALVDLESAREIDPNHLGVLQALDRLYAALSRHRERAEILEALAGIAEPEERVAVWCEAGGLYAGSLSDPRRAVYHLMRAVAEAPDPSPLRAELLRALGEALRATGPLDAWARCAEAELSALDPDAPVFADRRLELHRELAGAYENDLGRREAALNHLRSVVDDASGDPESPGHAGRRAAEDSLLRLLETERHSIELETRLAARLTREPEDAERWLDLARLREQKLHTPASAAAAYRKLVSLASDSLLGIRGLSRTCERIRDWPGAVQALELELEQSASRPPSERAALHHRLGQIRWRELGSNALAVRSFTAALEASETDPDSMHALQELFEEMEDWSSALDIYEREVSTLGEADRKRRRVIWLRVASLALNQSRDHERALHAYQSAQALGELTTHQRRVLADLHRRVDDLASFSKVLGDWCDDPESGASCDDHLEVADALMGLGRTDDAVKRVDRALTCDECSVRAWDLAASLREELGNQSRAVEALWRASMLLSGNEAAHRLLHAASLCEADDLERALDLARAAVERDPGGVRGQTTLARIAQGFAASDEALEAAKTALELADAVGPEADELAVIAALAGGAAARQVGRAVDALRFFSLVLASQPDHPDALAGRGESLAELGDLAGARRALEARLDRGDHYPARAHHLMLVGLHFVAAEEPDAALERFEAAIRDDPKLDEAHRQIAALHEASDHIEAGVACLERWAALTDEPGVRATRLLRAVEWEMRSDGQQEAAERHLRQILEADPGCGRAWQVLTDVLRATDRCDEALATSALALAGLEDTDVVAALALTRGQLLEEGGDLREAADAFGIAAPHCAEAALARARLLRTLGEWQAAADTLREFVTLHGGGNLSGLTESLEQLGRLLAGPLEDFDGAIVVYQRAVHLDPDRAEARQTLAGLLARTPDQWRVALDHLRVLLESDPTDRASLRTVLDIVREQGHDMALDNGLTILRALGIASERELEEAPVTLSLRVASDPRLPNPVFEALRQLAHGAAREITQALDATENPELPSSGDFASAVLTAEARLTAPALLPLSDEQLGEVLQILATLVLEPAEVHGDGALVNSLSAALGWLSRRRLRRTLTGHLRGALCAVEVKAWRLQVRTLARAVALDDGGGDLRAALEGLVREAEDGSIRDLDPSTDLTILVSGTPAANCLLRRTLHAWLDSL